MRFLQPRSFVLPVLILGFSLLGNWVAEGRSQTVVSYQTEDGWTIYGTLHLPENVSGVPAPGIVLLPEPEWVDRSIYGSYLAEELAEKGMAALSIDFRGTGASIGKGDFESFSTKDLETLRLDVKGAVQFLSSQKTVDAHRIGVVGAGLSADYAVREASENSRIQAIVMISGSLSATAKDLVESREDLPVLGIAGKNDKESFREMTEAYYLSKNKDSDLILAVGHGAVMFSHTEGLEQQVIQWLEDNLKGLGTETEVSFQSDDGWTLQGNLRLPDGADKNSKLAGVVMVHGAKHDQQTYAHLSEEIVKKGMAALRFDWRSKGRSINAGKGIYEVDLPAGELANLYLDVKAAIEFLASQEEVDASRIGIVAATLSCVHALHAASGDPRIQTVVLLTSLEPTPEARQFLTTSDVPIFAIASTEDNNYQRGSLAETTRAAYRLSKSRHSEMLLYDDAGRGSEMFKTKRELQPMVVRWLAEKLAGNSSGNRN